MFASGALALIQATASPECREVAVPFLCWYIFGLCDNSNETLYLPSADECAMITTEICAQEFSEIGTRFPGVVPQCESLPNTTVECEGESE